MEKAGFVVTRCYYSTIEDIVTALENNEKVIVAIDGGELLGDKTAEIKEDLLVGQIPDHTVVVLSVNDSDKTITIYDPNSVNPEDTYPIKMFEDAWNDSKNYLVTITYNCMKPYNPKPIAIKVANSENADISPELINIKINPNKANTPAIEK